MNTKGQEQTWPLFSYYVTELLGELVVFELYEELMAVLEGKSIDEPIDSIDKMVREFHSRCELRSGASLATGIGGEPRL